ncbi:slipin family protein [Castellaniella sp.]|uniref:slipin family protein n=1 Tax=Castellaniella sp. TaxID=1955812 RepID=UPI002AFF4C1F|nr:slipin family protein [Castellaniella sp.]
MFLDLGSGVSLIVLIFLLLVLFKLFHILREYERAVVFTLGRFTGAKGPGLIIVIPFLQQIVRVDMRVITMDIPPQDVISRDNVSVQVNAVVYFRVVDPGKAIIQVEHFLEATSQLAQTTLRAVLGKHELDEMLSEREKLNLDVQTILDAQTDGWGIKVTNVEIKHIDLNETMVRAMARQAEAERDRRAKVIHAEGERQAAQALAEAAHTLAREPSSMQLRYLETLTQVAGDKSSTLVFPIPIDLLAGFIGQTRPTPPATGLSPRPPADRPADQSDATGSGPVRPE